MATVRIPTPLRKLTNGLEMAMRFMHTNEAKTIEIAKKEFPKLDPAIVEAVNRAGQKAFHFFSGMIPEVVVELARTLARDWLPGDLERTIFINTGSEATEVALRMAKMYTDGYEVLVLGGSWHGITGGASAVSMASDRKGYGVPPPGVFVIPEPNAYRMDFLTHTLTRRLREW